MAIVDMKKVSVIGLGDKKAQLLKEIMDLGVVEINNQEDKLSNEQWRELVEKDGDESTVSELDDKISVTSVALEALNKYFLGKKLLFKTRKPLTESEFNNQLGDLALIEEKVNEINQIFKEISNLKNHIIRIETAIIALKPWIDYEVPLETKGTESTSIFIGTTPATLTYDEVVLVVSGKSDLVEVYKVASDETQNYFSVVCIKEDKEKVLDALRISGFNLIVFNEFLGNAKDNRIELKTELLEVKKELINKERTLFEMEIYRTQIELLFDSYIISRDKSKILSVIVKTKSAFYFDGWLPKNKEDEVKALLDSNLAYYEFEEPQAGEQMPILMKQNLFSEPFESVTNMYSTPSINDIDPTPFLAPFYFIFFGLMLSDAGYGIIMWVACFILLKKFRFEGLIKKLITMFMYCGISTVFWGILFGGWFGDFIPVAAKVLFGKEIVINPLWFNPVEEPMLLLVFSLGLGVIHLFVGMGLKAYILIKTGNTIDAICDIFLWYVLLIGLVLFGIGDYVLPIVKTIGMGMSIFGTLGVLFTGGRSKNSLIGKLVGGLGSLYNITAYLSDVLSYSRLLALGLATGVVAQVINTLGALAGGGLKGALVMTVAFFVGHLFNMAINVLGSFVHASRLQYVEFFGKFFDGGGKAFSPFNRKTKYVDIIKEEK